MSSIVSRFFSVSRLLPESRRLGPLPSTRDAYSSYIHLAWPATLQGLFFAFMTSIDLAMVGALGAKALAAVGIMSQPKMLLLVFTRALCVAVTAMVARRKGEEDYGRMNSVLKQGVVLNILIYVPLLLLASYFLYDILYWSGAESDYIGDAQAYGQFILGAIFFSSVSQIIGAALIGVGNTRMIFIANAIGNVINTVLNFLLIYGMFGFPKWGVMGAGVATLVGNVVIMILLMRDVWGHPRLLSLSHGGSWLFSWRTVKGFFTLGGSSLGEQVFERFGMYVYTIMVAELGTVALATHHVCMNLCDIFYNFSMGMGYSCASYAGQSLGKQRSDLARLYGKIGIRLGIVVSAIACLLYIVFRYPLMHLYTTSPAVDSLGSWIIVIMAISSFPQTFQLVYSGVLKGAGDNYYVMKYSLISIAIIRPIVTYVLCFPLGLGLYGAWLALLLDQTMRMGFARWRFRGDAWMYKTV